MKFKRLRIAWTVGWGLVMVLLLGCWIQSYKTRMSREILVTPCYRYYVQSLRGTVAFSREARIFMGIEFQREYKDSDFLHLTTNAGIKVLRSNTNGATYAVCISYWPLELVSIAIPAAPWFHWHFGLRTLLTSTTLFALSLGTIVWLAHR